MTGLTYTPGTPIWLRAQFEGASPTTIRIRAWSGGSEPSGWAYTATDSQSQLQDAGAAGVRAYLGSTASPLTLSWDNLEVTDLP